MKIRWRKIRIFGGYWGWFWNKRWLWICLNEGGREFAFNLRLRHGAIPVGFYVAIRIWGDIWFRRALNLHIVST